MVDTPGFGEELEQEEATVDNIVNFLRKNGLKIKRSFSDMKDKLTYNVCLLVHFNKGGGGGGWGWLSGSLYPCSAMKM